MVEQSGDSNNSKNRKKALLVSMLAFLLTGGAVFLFFVIQGSRDLTGANKKANFTYGEAAREGASSFFKFIGFEDTESLVPEGDKERVRIKEYEAAGLLDTLAPAAPATPEESVPWGKPPPSGRSAAPSNIPKMGGGTAGLGAIGGGGTRSSGGGSRFGGDSGAGNTKIAAAAQDSGTGVKGKDSLASLAKTRALLGDGLRSGSAATAKGKWDSSFGVGRSGGGGGSDLAYGKTGLVNLDKIKKGEVDNLKTTDPRSLKVPEVGAPEVADKDKAKNGSGEKKSSAQEALEKSMASSVLGAMGQGLSSAAKPPQTGGAPGRSEATGPASSEPNPFRSGTCESPSAEGCSATGRLWSDSTDRNANYSVVALSGEGTIMKVTYNGEGPGVTEGMEDRTVSYADTCYLMAKPGGEVEVLSCTPPVEVAK